MHEQLAQVDPESASRLHPNHSQRILRALEVFKLTGTALSSMQKLQQNNPLPFRPIQIALMPADRQVLNRRIEQRFDQMLAAGFVEEVQRLHARGDLNPDLPAIRAVGYRQAWEHIEGRVDLAGLRETGIAATRQLAKRQLTWLRSWPDLAWLLTEEPFDQQKVRMEALKLLVQASI
jgi:tRNA dimethylallyltransferase